MPGDRREVLGGEGRDGAGLGCVSEGVEVGAGFVDGPGYAVGVGAAQSGQGGAQCLPAAGGDGGQDAVGRGEQSAACSRAAIGSCAWLPVAESPSGNFVVSGECQLCAVG